MIDVTPAGKGGGPSPFVNAFDHSAVGSLRYNTSQAGSAVEELARPQHGVHHDRELSGDCDRGTLEADPFLEHEPPCPKGALG